MRIFHDSCRSPRPTVSNDRPPIAGTHHVRGVTGLLIFQVCGVVAMPRLSGDDELVTRASAYPQQRSANTSRWGDDASENQRRDRRHDEAHGNYLEHAEQIGTPLRMRTEPSLESNPGPVFDEEPCEGSTK